MEKIACQIRQRQFSFSIEEIRAVLTLFQLDLNYQKVLKKANISIYEFVYYLKKTYSVIYPELSKSDLAVIYKFFTNIDTYAIDFKTDPHSIFESHKPLNQEFVSFVFKKT